MFLHKDIQLLCQNCSKEYILKYQHIKTINPTRHKTVIDKMILFFDNFVDCLLNSYNAIGKFVQDVRYRGVKPVSKCTIWDHIYLSRSWGNGLFPMSQLATLFKSSRFLPLKKAF